MVGSLHSNRECANASPQAKKLLYENLPFPFPLVIGLFLFFALVFPYILFWIFHDGGVVEIIQMITIVGYMFFIIGTTFHKYRKKTGRNLAEDINTIQYTYETEPKKTYPRRSSSAFYVIFFFMLGFIGFVMILSGFSGLARQGSLSAAIFVLIIGILIVLFCVWFFLRLTHVLSPMKGGEKFALHLYTLSIFAIPWSIACGAVWLVLTTPSEPPLWVYAIIVVMSVFPILWSYVEKRSEQK